MLEKDIDELMEVLNKLKSTEQKFEKIIIEILRVINGGGTLFFCGNGGSASESQHLATEYIGVLEKSNPRKGIKAITLGNDPTYLTAWSNDFGFENIFSRQLETLASEKDLLFVYTTSGNSKNCVNVLKRASELNIPTICFTGRDGGLAKSMASITILVPSEKTARIQEVHLMLGHAICAEIEERLKV